MDNVNVLMGEWSLEMTPPGGQPSGDVGARVTFEPMGEKFVIERWTVPVPGAPDGIAVIGYDEGRGTLLQHYFDERGVARVYEMSLENGVWKLARIKPDFSPLEFTQRFTGTFSEDRRTIDGRWEICHDGATWEHDFDLTYRKLS
jgi:hypothetical protein